MAGGLVLRTMDSRHLSEDLIFFLIHKLLKFDYDIMLVLATKCFV